jgi:ribulose-phosphate 3-epimerase
LSVGVENMGLEAGLAFDVDTEIEKIPDGTDVVLIMGRKSGFQANEFQEDTINKIKKVVQAREGKDAQYYKIGIDGGVNLDTIKKIKEAGAEIAYCGRTVFDAILNDNLEKLDYAINN